MARQARIVIPGLPYYVVAWIRQNITTGRPTASREFIKTLELETGTSMTPQPGGRKPAAANAMDLTEDMFA